MQTVTNNRKAAHTIFTKDGPIKVKAGETREVDITAAEAKEVEAAGLEFGKAPTKAAKEAVKADEQTK